MEENKQGYVDTLERIDAFHDAIWDSGLSMRAKIAIHGICESPAQLKEVIDNDFTGRRFYGIGVKTKAEIRSFFDKFEKEHPAEAYKELSPREKMSYNLHRNIDELTDDEINFILDYQSLRKSLSIPKDILSWLLATTWEYVECAGRMSKSKSCTTSAMMPLVEALTGQCGTFRR